MNSCAGFVLAGGASTRMGRDKALLPWAGGTLLEHVAAAVREAAGSVTVIAPPGRYHHLGLDCVPDLIPGCGPLGGLYTALSLTGADWNLIAACDLPGLTAGFLTRMLDAARRAGRDALVPQTPDGLQPLCAVYHRRLRAAAGAAIHRKSLKMHDFVSGIDALLWPVAEAAPLANLNTPEQLAR
jgi:molybdopterin-guanine dinucleotide biosynthesis protein A